MDYKYDENGKRISGFRKFLKFMLIILVIGYVGVITYMFATKENKVDDKKTEANVEDEVPKTQISEKYRELHDKIKEYIGNENGTISVYFRDYKTSDEFGISDLEEYEALDTINIPMNLYLYKLVQDETINLKEKIVYKDEYVDDKSVVIKESEIGTEYTLEELSKLSIEKNDYSAIKMLKSKLGEENYIEYMKELGGQVEKKGLTSCKDMGYYIEKVLSNNENSKEIGSYLIEYLKKSSSVSVMKKLLPKAIEVGGIKSSGDNYQISVGAVFTKNPYILCIVVNDNGKEKSDEIISSIFKFTHDFQVSLEF